MRAAVWYTSARSRLLSRMPFPQGAGAALQCATPAAQAAADPLALRAIVLVTLTTDRQPGGDVREVGLRQRLPWPRRRIG